MSLVQAEFKPGGKKYTYEVPGAQIGDIITGPGNTGPATVVAFGRTQHRSPIKVGTIVKRRSTAMHPNAHPAHGLIDTRSEVEQAEELLADAKKRAKQQHKQAATAKAAAKERVRRRKLAFGALERVAAQTDNHSAAMAAAVELLKHTA